MWEVKVVWAPGDELVSTFIFFSKRKAKRITEEMNKYFDEESRKYWKGERENDEPYEAYYAKKKLGMTKKDKQILMEED